MTNPEQPLSLASLTSDMNTLIHLLRMKADRTRQRVVDTASKIESLNLIVEPLSESVKQYESALALRWDRADEDLRSKLESTHARLAGNLATKQTELATALASKESMIGDIEVIEVTWATAPETTSTPTQGATLASNLPQPIEPRQDSAPTLESRLVAAPAAIPTKDGHTATFLRLTDRLSHATGHYEIASATDDALSHLDELTDSELIRILNKLLTCHQSAGLDFTPPLSGLITETGELRHDPHGARILEDLRSEAKSRREYTPTINTWVTRLEQEALDLESHAAIYTPMQLRLLVQKIAFDGKMLCATYREELGVVHRDRLRRHVFGKTKSVKEQYLKQEFVEGFAQDWNADALPVFWETLLEDINIKIARAFAVAGPELRRPRAAPENHRRHEDFEASYSTLVRLLTAGADDSHASATALPSIIESAATSAKGDPREMDVLARLLAPYPELVVGRNLRGLRKVIDESQKEHTDQASEVAIQDSSNATPTSTHVHPLVLRARARLSGKRIVIIGGTRREERVCAIKEAFELSELEWASVEFNSGRQNIDRVRRQLLDGRYDAAFILIKYTSHAVTEGLSDCRDRCFMVQSGYGAVSLAKAVLGKQGDAAPAAA